MNGHVQIFLVRFVTIEIRNIECQEVVAIQLNGSATFKELHNEYKEKSGHVLFDFTFNGVIVDLNETPLSLGLNNHAVFICVPRLVNISIRNNISGEIEHRYHGSRAVTFRSIKEETIEKRNGNSTFIFSLNRSVIRDNATPNSLMMEDEVEILLEPYSIIDVRDSVTQKVAQFKLRRADTFRILLDTYREYEEPEGSDKSSFDLYFNGAIVDLDKDTPESLGMRDLEEVVCVQQLKEEPPEEKCSCINCTERRILGLDEADDTEACEYDELPSTINIIFVDTSSSDKVVLRHGYDEKLKTLLSRYAAMRELPFKSLRFKYEDRMLFVSSIGNKSPYDLGMQHNDIVYASRLGNADVKHDKAGKTKKSRPSHDTGAKKGKAKSKGKKRAPTQPTYSTIDKEERLRRAHSKMLSLVFDEANLQFKKIRQHLNSLALEQTPPKSKSASPQAHVSEPKSAPSDISSLSLDNKAIKTRFSILAGEVSNLYKSTKPSKKMKAQATRESITIDLHGYTKEAAVEMLDASLPSWIDTAMHGEYPFVVHVTIICGAGGQVLSEVVEKWIRENERVANARKNMFI